MKINRVSNIPDISKRDNTVKKTLSPLQSDVFQKSNTVSFTGIKPVSFLTKRSLIDVCNTLLDSKCYNIIKQFTNSHRRNPAAFNSLFSGYPEDVKIYFKRNKIFDFPQLKKFLDLYKKYSSDIIQIYDSKWPSLIFYAVFWGSFWHIFVW